MFYDLKAMVKSAKERAANWVCLYDEANIEATRQLIPEHSSQLAIRADLCAGIIYTRDEDPPSEHALHLSVSFLAMPGAVPTQHYHDEAIQIVQAFWGENAQHAIMQVPETDPGIARDVHHYRLEVDENWQPTEGVKAS